MLDRFNAWEGWFNNHSSRNPSITVPIGNSNAGAPTNGYDKPAASTATINNSNDLQPSAAVVNTGNTISTGVRRRSIPGGANAMAQGLPPPDLIYTMVGTYGFGLDEQLMDPTIPGFEYMSQ